MKKLFLTLVISLFLAAQALAAGSSNTITLGSYPEQNLKVVTFTWVGDDGNGSVPNATTSTAQTNEIQGWYCFMAITNPGATAPLDNYDIVINDADSVDIFGGKLMNRDTTNSEQAVPLVGGAYMGRTITGAITMVMTNQTNVDAVGTLQLFFSK